MAIFTETIKLDDQVSPAAKAAANSVGQAAEAVRGLGASSKLAAKEFPNLTDALLKVQKAEGTGAAQKLESKNAATQAAKSTRDFASAQKEAAQGAEALSADLAASVGVFLAIAAAAGAVVVGLGALVVKGALFAIEASESKQAMLGLFDAMGGGITTGAQTEEMIDNLKAKFGIAKESLIQYTNELQRMGMTDLGQIEHQLLAVSSAAALVKGGDEALLSFTKKIQLATESGAGLKIPVKQLAQLSATGANVGDVAKVMGVSVEKLTKDLSAGTVNAAEFGDALNTAIITKGQGPLERMAASSANLKKLLSEAWGDLFEDIDVGPFMAEVKKLFDIFGQGAESGKALKAGIGGFFKQVFEYATKVVPLVKHFLLDLVIYGLKAHIALKPIVKTVKEFLASATGKAVIDGLVTAMKALGVVAAVIVGALVMLGGLLVTMSAAMGVAIGLTIQFVGSLISLAADGVSAVVGFVGQAWDALTEWVSGASQAASDFVMGLVGGITAGASKVVSAVSGLAKAALNAFTGKDGIDAHSPSLKMIKAGGHMTDGAVEGIESGTSDVHGASTGMATAAVKGASSGGDSPSASGGKASGANITVMVQIDGAGKSALELTEEMVSSVFQRMALEAGL